MSHPSGPRRSRIAHFKAPFLLSVAGAAAVGLACGGETGADDPCADGGGCNPPASSGGVCPAEPPEIGTSCAGEVGGLECSYDYCAARLPMRRCDASTGQWEDIPLPTCNPPPPAPECPDALPFPGSDCSAAPFVCEYVGGCEKPSTAQCQSGQWLVVYSSGPACNPPAVIPVCPERELVAGDGCVYEGQACSRAACDAGATTRAGHVCASGLWQEVALSCSPDGGVPEGGG